MIFEDASLPGVRLLRPTVHRDERGGFVKTHQQEWFEAAGIPTEWPERFYSVSSRGVLRGLHFQLPPSAHAKLVYCPVGAVMDVVVDLRVGSPTYQEFESFDLDGNGWTMLFLPAGLAHGFVALRDGTVMAYATGTIHDPERDTGIRWDSVGVPWPFTDPLVSPRDAALPALAEFESPFTYGGE
ncbi:MAG: dTDP-4-dehydrorhamnose 3,5-epimerase [Acidimicrobiaceae bacterium]|nr:dTDP-4-dehydrorhamnose 3,5-epimerase [Acidimicrobiaceae bacterium]